MREAKVMLIELWLPTGSDGSVKAIKEISFLTYTKELISIKVSSVKAHKFKNRVKFAIDTLIEGISPASLKELATLETKDGDVSFDIAEVVVYGYDQNGNPIAHTTEISQKYNSNNPKVRHLVVTGVHGNFKGAQQAFKRASRIKGSRVIKLRA